jgi:hypothetical protein
MTPIRFLLLAAGVCLCSAPSRADSAASLTSGQQACLGKARRFERAGWIYLHIEGEPWERGFQHGYLLAKEIAAGLSTARVRWEHQSALDWQWLVNRAAAMFVPKIDQESLAELEGISEGLRAAGQPVSREELIAYNGIIELSDYWWPIELKKIKDAPPPSVRESCSSFIATGSLTRDGNVVLGHNTMQDYADVFPNVVQDIVPARGHRIFWQTTPGWIHSGTDFFITDAGLVGSETTIGRYEGFDTNGVPEFVRMRRATQDAASIEQWCDIMKRGNNGGYANAWLLGDVRTKEIARLEIGLKYVGFEKKRDGYFIGSNIAEDPKILRFETNSEETDIRASSVARRVRWKQLLKQYGGKVDCSLAKRFESDHLDTWRGKVQPGGRTLCGHFDLDPEAAGSWPGVPYGCAGTVDGKAVDADMASRMAFAARWGAACGAPFVARKFLAAHPQFEGIAGILQDRPAQPWVDFHAGE